MGLCAGRCQSKEVATFCATSGPCPDCTQTGEPPLTETGRAFSFGVLEEPGPEKTSFPGCRETLVMMVHCFEHSCFVPSAVDSPGISFHLANHTRGREKGNAFCGAGKDGERREIPFWSFYHSVHQGKRRTICHLVLPMTKAHCMISGRLYSLPVSLIFIPQTDKWRC